MKRIFHILFLFALFSVSIVAQQEKQVPTELLEAIFEQIAENRETEDFDQTEILDDLYHYAQYPINLNATNKKELEKLHFLNDTQIENLLYYLYMYFPMENIFELQLIEGFYKQDIRNLLPFVTVERIADKPTPIKFKNMLKHGKHELLTRLDKGLETKEGYKFVPDEELVENPNKQYIGNPFYYSLKYRYRYSNRILAGVTTEKDAGEQSWGAYNKGFDFYSGYVQLNDFGRFKTLVVGDFSASFGQGLVMSTTYGFGKSSLVLNLEARNEGLRKCGSTNETNFFRGIGSTVKFGRIELTSFYSNKIIDGDTVGNFFSSIKTDGLHRTINDLSKKNTVNIQVVGTHVSMRFEKVKVGITLTNLQLNKTLSTTPYPYNYYYFSGNQQTAGSVDYKIRWRKFSFFGETAITNKFAPATINSLGFNPSSTVSLMLLQRYYSPTYDVLFANAFGESSRNNNEEGLYLGTEIHPYKSWKISAYADCFSFPWLKYGIDKPSVGYDLLIQADYSPKEETRMYVRYRFKQKENNITNDSTTTPFISNYNRGSLRYVLQYAISDKLKLQNTLEGTYSQKASDKPTYGILLAQDLSYSFTKLPLSFNLRYELFDAMNYENRIYTYEKDILYAFSIPALYGKGSRYYLNIKYNLWKNLSLYVKIGQTTYIHKEIIGSGLEEIDGNRKTDVRVLLKCTF
ncbi:MAG: hypothetical protein JXQ69_00755 [Paludibacteraceae bacterium]|nr:hypothetical protein [Paludibacteraceae bacterium]MBN2786827.1 hypothetical protein [Paludibacteraceae bacterium]